jgi:hypothetical protein
MARFRGKPAEESVAPPFSSPDYRRVTSAWTYAAYRDELLACGFSRVEAFQLVVLAATGQRLVTDHGYEVAAEPPVPMPFRAPAVSVEGLSDEEQG